MIEPDDRIVCERPLVKAILRQINKTANNETFFVCILVKFDADIRAKRNRIVARNKNVWLPMSAKASRAPKNATSILMLLTYSFYRFLNIHTFLTQN